MSEKSAFNLLRQKLAYGSRRLDRIENPSVPGMPDVNGCFDGVEFWMEIKAPTEPKRSTTRLFGSNHKVSQEQKNWALRQLNAGGNVYLYISTNKRRMLLSGQHIEHANDMTVEQLERIAIWHATTPIKGSLAWHQLAQAVSRPLRMHTS